jgi:hypothetical protein
LVYNQDQQGNIIMDNFKTMKAEIKQMKLVVRDDNCPREPVRTLPKDMTEGNEWNPMDVMQIAHP